MEPWANCEVEKYAKGQWSVNCCEMGKDAVLAKKQSLLLRSLMRWMMKKTTIMMRMMIR